MTPTVDRNRLVPVGSDSCADNAHKRSVPELAIVSRHFRADGSTRATQENSPMGWMHTRSKQDERGIRALARAATLALLQIGWLAASPGASALTTQTISFATLSGKTFGAAPFTVSATASSGLAVSFASLTTTTCTVNGVTVTIIAAGTCTVRASQAGNASFAAAPPADRSFSITVSAVIQYTYDAAGNILKIQRIGSP
jgi:hypothetical protein